MEYCIAVTNVKGGVGKTTTAVNLAASMAVTERRVLVIDLVQEGGVGNYLGDGSCEPGIASLGQIPMKELIHSSPLSTLSFIPSNLNTTDEEIKFTNSLSTDYQLLKKEIASISDDFDIIVLDCPASMGTVVLAGLLAANLAIVPVQCEPNSLSAANATLRTIEQARIRYGSSVKLLGIVVTMYDSRTLISHKVLEQIWDDHSQDMLETVIPRNVRLAESFDQGTPAVLLDIDALGVQAYFQLAEEVMVRAPQVLAEPL